MSKGPIIISDDVWIGTGATILSGVRVGQGAVIGAGALISKDVPPYAVAVGNPARIVKYRFSEEIISKLLTIDFSRVDMFEINLDLILSKIDCENIDRIVFEKSLDCTCGMKVGQLPLFPVIVDEKLGFFALILVFAKPSDSMIHAAFRSINPNFLISCSASHVCNLIFF